MDSKSPTNDDSGNDADPPDLTIDPNSISRSYEFSVHNEEIFTYSQTETKIIDIPPSFSHEDSSGDDLSDFVLGLDLSSPRRLEFRLVEGDSPLTVPESQTYSSSNYKDFLETNVNLRTPVY